MLTNDYGTDNTTNNKSVGSARRGSDFVVESLLSARSEIVMMLFDTKKRQEAVTSELDALSMEEAQEFSVMMKAALTRIDRALIDVKRTKVHNDENGAVTKCYEALNILVSSRVLQHPQTYGYTFDDSITGLADALCAMSAGKNTQDRGSLPLEAVKSRRALHLLANGVFWDGVERGSGSLMAAARTTMSLSRLLGTDSSLGRDKSAAYVCTAHVKILAGYARGTDVLGPKTEELLGKSMGLYDLATAETFRDEGTRRRPEEIVHQKAFELASVMLEITMESNKTRGDVRVLRQHHDALLHCVVSGAELRTLRETLHDARGTLQMMSDQAQHQPNTRMPALIDDALQLSSQALQGVKRCNKKIEGRWKGWCTGASLPGEAELVRSLRENNYAEPIRGSESYEDLQMTNDNNKVPRHAAGSGLIRSLSQYLRKGRAVAAPSEENAGVGEDMSTVKRSGTFTSKNTEDIGTYMQDAIKFSRELYSEYSDREIEDVISGKSGRMNTGSRSTALAANENNPAEDVSTTLDDVHASAVKQKLSHVARVSSQSSSNQGMGR